MNNDILTLISDENLSNTYLIKGDDGYVMIDGGVKLEKVLEKIKDEKITDIFLTHTHFDHTFYVREIAEKFSSNIYMSEKGIELYQDPKTNLSVISDIYDEINMPKENIKALADIGEISINGLNVKYENYPGHSPCSMVYVIGENAFCGDLVFDSAIGRTDFYNSDREKMKESLLKFNELDSNEAFPGHGNSFLIKNNVRKIKMFARII